MRERLIELCREFCESVYFNIRNIHPEFYIHYYTDRVNEVEHASRQGEVLSDDDRYFLDTELAYRQARALLAKFYMDTVGTLTIEPDETLLLKAEQALTQAAELVPALTQNNPDAQAILMVELAVLGATLEGLTNG